MKQFSNKYVVFAFLLFAAAGIFVLPFLQPHQKEDVTQNLVEQANDFSEQLLAFSNDLEFVINQIQNHHKNPRLSLPKDAAFYIFEQDKLVRWSSNQFAVSGLERLNDGVHQLKNHWYLVKKRKFGSKEIFAILRIKREYRQENSYLQNSFHADFYLDKNWYLTKELGKYSFEQNIQLTNENPVFLGCDNTVSSSGLFFYSALEIGLLFLFLFAIIHLAKQSRQFLVVSSLVLILVRIALMNSYFLTTLKTTSIFLPQLYASSDFLPSLGDLLLHLIFIGILFYSWRKQTFKFQSKHRFVVVFLSFCCCFILFFAAYLVDSVVVSLFQNSQVNLDLSDFVNIDGFSVLVYFLFAVLFFLLHRLAIFSFKIINQQVSTIWLLLMMVLCAVLCIVCSISLEIGTFYIAWGFAIYALITYKISAERTNGIFFTNYLFELLIVSLLIASYGEKFELQRQDTEGKQFLARQAQERDPIAEFLLLQLGESLEKDEQLLHINREQLNKYLSLNYLSNYLNRFDIEVTEKSQLEHQLIEKGAHTAYTKIQGNLYQRLSEGIIVYKLELNSHSSLISIVFTAKQIPNGQGFPMLLANKSMENLALNSQQSYAKYRNRKLIEQLGNYNFPIESTKFVVGDSIAKASFYGKKTHYELLHKNDNVYVLATVNYSIRSLLSKFSYVALFFTILLFCCLLFIHYWRYRTIFPQSFSGRFQYALLFMLFFSTLILAYGSIYSLKEQYNKGAVEAISEKVKSIKKVLEKNNLLDSPAEGVQQQLSEIATSFYTDINLYNAEGQLIHTTQKNIFQAGLLSTFIHPVVYRKIYKRKGALLVQIEDIESMNYLSAYVPIFSENGELKYCLNLPYFAKTDELQAGINRFLLALMNMYLLLTGLSIVLALFISRRVSKPLELIKNKMAQLSLSNRNETINWKSEDEIGALIKEYNRMVSELSESAQQLAQAEREGAWKEMAQQVAHEIKNPLTPMKLNIQHLQMRWEGLNEEERNAAIKQLAENLVEQIDTLSEIATQFSNFAKLPVASFSEVKIAALLEKALNLFLGQENIEVVFNFNESIKAICVLGDKDQLLRIFNNIIKNAIQSIPKEKSGIIKVTIQQEKSDVLITVEDNGTGISDDLKSKVFQPRFTTKSSGMGLGLAMVKEMVENMEGSISFSSTVNKGTSFYLRFKLMDEKAD